MRLHWHCTGKRQVATSLCTAQAGRDQGWSGGLIACIELARGSNGLRSDLWMSVLGRMRLGRRINSME
jgi:hypothetical protein